VTDEEAFLNAIVANPNDRTTRLAYADWLDERDDPRAEFVRLHVRLDELTPDHSQFEGLVTRLEALKTTVPEHWLLLVTGPVWCVAGNIVHSHAFGPRQAEIRQGTRLFRPETKIYLAELWNEEQILAQHTDEHSRIRVVGQQRKSRKWIACILRTSYTTDWRVELVRQPGPLRCLKKTGWAGFRLRRGDFVCPEDKRTPEAIRGLLGAALSAALRTRPVRDPGSA
jgi:uncharacterized protein (TIGR02996 family)